jgi:hypothetical protein
MNTILSELPRSIAVSVNGAIRRNPEEAAEIYIQICEDQNDGHAKNWLPKRTGSGRRWCDLFASMGWEKDLSEADFPCPAGTVFLRELPEVCCSMSFLFRRLQVENSISKNLKDGRNREDLTQALFQIVSAEMVLLSLIALHQQHTGTHRLLDGGSDSVSIGFAPDGRAYALLEI